MNKANIRPIVEALGLLGIIASLIFVGIQLQRDRIVTQGVLDLVVELMSEIENEAQQVNVSTNTDKTEQLAARFGGKVTYVDSNGIRLRLVEAGSVKDRMKVVVGKPYRRTPVFSDKIRYLEINPYWNVPRSIAVRAELPQFRRDPGFIDRMGFEVYRGGKKIDPKTVNWNNVSAKGFPYTLKQKPGPKNALGRVKFIFPNKHAVYLHDTPSQGLFKKAVRAGSSGCIRLERPIDLAEQVLENNKGWDRKRIDEVLESAKNTRVDLPERLAVHLTYSTAWSGEGGTINFRPDVYKRDKKLAEALFKGQ